MRSERASDFWDRYFQLGKCWLDPEHRFYSVRWEARFADLRPVEQECRWCGLRQVLERYTVTVERERWVNVPDVTSTEVST